MRIILFILLNLCAFAACAQLGADAAAAPDAGTVRDAAPVANVDAGAALAPPVVVPSVSAPASVAGSLAAGIGAPDAPAPAAGDLVAPAKGAVAAVRDAIAKPTLMSIALAISLVLWVALGVIRRAGARWLSPRSIRLITLVAAPALSFLTAFGMGAAPWDAVMIAGGGPGALAFNELIRGIAPPKG